MELRAVLAKLAVLALVQVTSPAEAVQRDSSEFNFAVFADLVQARELLKQERHAEAVALLQPLAQTNADDADVHNLLGFALRKSGRLDEAFVHYARALELDADHREAREYLGELYLQRGEPERAREQLAVLERLCPAGCEERAELEEAIRAAAVH